MAEQSDSSEYSFLARFTDRLTTTIAADPIKVASKLLEVKLISLAQLDSVLRVTNSKPVSW